MESSHSNTIEIIQKLYQDMYSFSHQKDYQSALEIGEKLYQLLPNDSDLLSDLATYNIFLSNWVEAIKYALLCISLDSTYINAYDALAHAFGELQDWQQAGQYGRKALELRDAGNKAKNPVLPILPSKPKTLGKKNVISFSLFGSNSAYTETAVLNAQLSKEFYPNWICRFYIDETVPEVILRRLAAYHAEIIKVDAEVKKLPATMWRFLAMDDSDVGYVIFRDADAVISRREATTVQEWQASQKRFHTIRDASSHTELIMAGLWGAIAGSIPQFTEKMYDYCQKDDLHPRFADQYFLRDYIWQYLKQDLYASDRLFGFYQAHPITKAGENYDISHIGCDEGGFGRSIVDLPYPDGTRIRWSLYSQISPLPNDDLSPRYNPERLVCQYDAVVQHHMINIYIPRRYGDGLVTGHSRIVVDELEQQIDDKTRLVLAIYLESATKPIFQILKDVFKHIKYDACVILDATKQEKSNDLIQKFFTEKSIAGKVFSTNDYDPTRNHERLIDLARAKGDYIFYVDGNDTIEGYLPFPKRLDADAYRFTYATPSQELYQKLLLFKSDLAIQWLGTYRGYSLLDQSLKVEEVSGDYIIQGTNPERPLEEAKVLERQQEALKAPHLLAQNAFACAVAYQRGNNLKKACSWFKKVTQMSSEWKEGAYISALKLANYYESEHLVATADYWLERATVLIPTRAEAWYLLAKSHNLRKEYHLAYTYALMAKRSELLSVEFLTFPAAYQEGRDYELLRSAVQVGDFKEASWAFKQLLLSPQKFLAQDFYDYLEQFSSYLGKNLQDYL